MIRKSNIFWGVVLILLGGLFLIDSLGIMDINLWHIFGPVILIVFGVWLLAVYFIKEPPEEVESLSIPIKNAQRAIITIHHGAGSLKVESGAEPMELLQGIFAGGVDHSIVEDGDTLNAKLRFRSVGHPIMVFPWFISSKQQLKWDVRLTDNIPLDLKVKSGANEALLDLTNLQVNNLRLETGASSTVIKLPENVPYTKAVINAGVASLTVHIPEQVAAKIRFAGGLMDFRVDKSRFPKTGGYYQSPDYKSAPQQVELKIDGGVGSVTIR